MRCITSLRHEPIQNDQGAPRPHAANVQIPIGHLKVDEAFALGLKHHQAGRLDEAAGIYNQLLKVVPEHVDVVHFTGLLRAQTGDLTGAVELVEKAIALNPQSAAIRSNLGWVLKRAGQMNEAITTYQKAIELDPGFIDAHFNLAVLHRDCGQNEAALVCVEALLALNPNHLKAGYMKAALTEKLTVRPPEGFVAQIFDEHADVFEEQMKVGNSTIPEIVRGAADFYLKDNPGISVPPFTAVLDLGCGTGRAGEVFRDLTGTLHGVDLSAKMMEQAKAKNLYDKLVLDDFVHFMSECNETFDLVLSVDAFLYMGPLEDVFENVARVLNPGGSFGFTVEALEEGDYALRPSCRHAQSESYIRRLAAANGFRIEICEHIEKLRFDIQGTLFWLVKA